MWLVLARDADLDEAIDPVAVRALEHVGIEVGESEDRRERAPRHPPVRALALPVGDPERLEALDRRRRDRGVQLHQRVGIHRPGAADVCRRRRRLGPRVGQVVVGRAVQHPFLAVPDEARLHEQLDVVVGVGAGDMEPGRAALLALAQDLLDEPEADLARARSRGRAGRADGVKLHDGPVVAPVLPLHPDEAGHVPIGLVHEEKVVRPDGDEGQTEQAEHADRRAVDRQPERARAGAFGLGDPR